MHTDSLSIGSVAWRDRFFSDQFASAVSLEKRMQEAVIAATEVFTGIAPGICKAGWSEAYASSGTMKMLALICEAHGYGRGRIELQALYTLSQKLAACITDGSELPGLKESRRDLLLPGWCHQL